MPLFNAFTPLDAGELRTAIMSYAKSTAFPLKGIFVVDGSKRSSKANAFFSGLGKNKRIGLFDTLIDKHSIPELVAVVAHEVGHYKKGHIMKSLGAPDRVSRAVFFVLSFVLQQVGLFEAFYMTEMSVHAGLVFFGLLFTPVDLTLSMYVNAVSRKNEFEADAFAASTTGNGEHLVTALKKLSADSLSNLTPAFLPCLSSRLASAGLAADRSAACLGAPVTACGSGALTLRTTASGIFGQSWL